MTTDQVLAMAAEMDRQHPGERWRIWMECGRHEGLPPTTDDPYVAYCHKCWCLFRLSPGQVPAGPAVTIGELLNPPSR